MFVPEGYGTVFPYMIVDGAEDLVTFLKQVFDATEVGRTRRPSGQSSNIRLRIGTSVFMVSEAASSSMQAMPGTYYVYVDDVDATFAQALDAGASEIFEPADMPYEDRQAGVRDASGNIWWISKRLVERPYD